MKKVKFDIQGMTCSSCSSHVEKAVRKFEGIQKLNVNLLSNNMIVEYDEQVLDNDKIINAVKEAGYGASIIEDQEQKAKTENKMDKQKEVIKGMKTRLVSSILFLIPLMYIAMYQMIEHHLGIEAPNFIKNIFSGTENALIFAFTQFLLVLPIVYINRNYYIVGFRHLWKRTPNMDSLIAIGSSAAMIYGIFAMYMIAYGLGHSQITLVEKYAMDLYFESAGMILTLITVGKYLETKSKGKTNDAIRKLINLSPKTAIVLRNDEEIEIDVENVLEGDILMIKPGSRIPVDGKILEGFSSIDQSVITGESIPIDKTVGDIVISGTINQNGYLKIEATKVGKDTTLAQIIRLVEDASNSKAPIARLADKISGIFVPCVMIIAILATIFWILQGQSFVFALSIGISVLVISCPCALGLATPVAIMVGTGKGAENGILIKSAESLELLHLVDTVVLDKTGTITEGKPKVMEVITNQTLMNDALNGNGRIKFVQNKNNFDTVENELLRIVGSLEKNSEHPLAIAILEKASEKHIELLETEKFETIPGKGIKAEINGRMYFVGNLGFMKENHVMLEDATTKIEILLKESKTVVYCAKENKLLGMITISDFIKPSSKKAIQDLKKRKIDVVMLTGDNEKTAQNVGSYLGIDHIVAEVLPQDKEKEVEKLQKSGRKVAFVGDGINDSPALVKSDVGIAIGSGTDIAIDSADIVLTKNDLSDVVTAIRLSTAVIKNIKMNLFWAFFYNMIGIPVAAGVFYLSHGLKLNPMIGAAAMSLSSVCVVTNALRLRKFKSHEAKEISTKNSENRLSLENNEDSKKEELKMKTIKIEGMSCNHCKMSVEKALNSIGGVKKVEVDLAKKQAVIESDIEIDDNIIREVIEEAGFEIGK